MRNQIALALTTAAFAGRAENEDAIIDRNIAAMNAELAACDTEEKDCTFWEKENIRRNYSEAMKNEIKEMKKDRLVKRMWTKSYMMSKNTLISTADGQDGQVMPLYWAIEGEPFEPFDEDYSDGYRIKAIMQIMGSPRGVAGSCVEAVNAEDTGNPVVCHILGTSGAKLTTLSEGDWNGGQPLNQGSTVGNGVRIATKTLPRDQVDTDVIPLTAERAAELAIDFDAELAIDDAFQDDEDWQGDGSDAEMNVEEDEEDMDDEEDFTPQGPPTYVKYLWYQPLAAKAYYGIRRFAKDDMVNSWALTLDDEGEGLTATKISSYIVLKGAVTLAASAIALGSAALAF